MATTVDRECESCHQPFKAPLKEINRGNGKYCCRSCAASHQKRLCKPKEPNVECAYCGIRFYKNKSKKKVSRSGLFFCCREHKDLAQRLGGIEAIQPDHYNTGDGHSSYRVVALRALPHVCNRCGWEKHPEALLVHHIDHDRSNNDVSNLEILCPNCHVIEHRYPHLLDLVE